MKQHPQIKFLKAVVPEILAGRKTMEVRPRSMRWINTISQADVVDLTWGARFAAPTIFAQARIERVDVKPYTETTQEDVRRFGGRWQNGSVAAFIAGHERWYAQELQKGNPVVWIYFALI